MSAERHVCSSVIFKPPEVSGQLLLLGQWLCIKSVLWNAENYNCAVLFTCHKQNQKGKSFLHKN